MLQHMNNDDLARMAAVVNAASEAVEFGRELIRSAPALVLEFKRGKEVATWKQRGPKRRRKSSA